ncbi:hypothetical protein [Streptomyces sp. NRRL S-118]|uniref:hypothetical protein n=1 Tax=Streptomyces sp. NRRL S-118 TaxID=1463881 RepID=UPI00131E75A1|nr:hypothetical protein [Streptomyces sp. NRRL S-118]
MKITRYGEPCPLCRTPLLLDVLQVRSAQSDFPTTERVTGRRCPGCRTTRPAQWKKVMRSHCSDA